MAIGPVAMGVLQTAAWKKALSAIHRVNHAPNRSPAVMEKSAKVKNVTTATMQARMAVLPTAKKKKGFLARNRDTAAFLRPAVTVLLKKKMAKNAIVVNFPKITHHSI